MALLVQPAHRPSLAPKHPIPERRQAWTSGILRGINSTMGRRCAHLGERAGALVLDLVVADVQLHQLLVGVLLQRPRQLHAPRVALQRHTAERCDRRIFWGSHGKCTWSLLLLQLPAARVALQQTGTAFLLVCTGVNGPPLLRARRLQLSCTVDAFCATPCHLHHHQPVASYRLIKHWPQAQAQASETSRTLRGGCKRGKTLAKSQPHKDVAAQVHSGQKLEAAGARALQTLNAPGCCRAGPRWTASGCT